MCVSSDAGTFSDFVNDRNRFCFCCRGLLSMSPASWSLPQRLGLQSVLAVQGIQAISPQVSDGATLRPQLAQLRQPRKSTMFLDLPKDVTSLLCVPFLNGQSQTNVTPAASLPSDSRVRLTRVEAK
ncbi:hypothetical protein AVEN_30735-1 [Araneus ventricosus]|uniref:Uncharacterized protein n=1 Tax=Araneus ventricosus TaxID=182803 RepID=A0A4Y2KSE0_ARAVE|nr:hypothetical protein AVEN_30735-1 [Araneus ventricosus]